MRNIIFILTPLLTACGRTRVTHSFTISPLVLCAIVLGGVLFVIHWITKQK
jgi:hypothetical protein